MALAATRLPDAASTGAISAWRNAPSSAWAASGVIIIGRMTVPWNSARVLGELGFDVQWQRYPMAHQVCAEEIRDLGDWMARRFAL